MTDNEKILVSALRAIVARITGDWDDPDLLATGPLGMMDEAVVAIARNAIAKLEGRTP